MALFPEQPDLQNSKPIELVPVLEGGGTRLSAHIGILKALKELNIHFERLVGVSGGSIVTALYASGLSLEEIESLIVNTDFNKYLSFSLIRLIRKGGFCSGDGFENWMDDKLKGITFRELKTELHIVATDIKRGCSVIFDRHTTPDLPVSLAVRFSMSIPLMFAFKPFGDYLMTDGCVLSEESLHRDWSEEGTPVLCFRLRGEYDNEDVKINPFFPLPSYVNLLMRTFITAMSREYINEKFWHKTVIVDTGKSSPVDFSISREQKLELVKRGYETTLEIVPWKILKSVSPDFAKKN
ncbi:MAG: patatin-like phospholipase family protein [Xenococcaceae cyanobacterium MO_188.B32]|nr:patatin-like phospholipase family protein [Xenococcaceae cyanobacterium MO_188.B32]